MPKKDYYRDPEAPRANSLAVAVAVFIQDESGRLLMIERTDNGYWAIPGGAQDVGETTREAAIREVREETGIDVAINEVIGIYSDPHHVIAYDDGEVRQEFSILLRGRPTGGELRTSYESRRVHWVPPPEIESLTIHPSMRLRVEHGLQDRHHPYLS
ncbi:NUDIX domain-containing protein [Allosaccharopolyspora coralli]|uniref:NUDIX domain-containing protein n=1 Tax=Allosaccharopolyspora coralli TaxID=2665642 RepID=A0A5Q3QCX2_9PSEU|nr:NUDIX domain-containing protein [Allosaccharopolyspora coralli]QGK71196.1 NUDIX domain-containing protein [Allosaccharopolyspora coralli]